MVFEKKAAFTQTAVDMMSGASNSMIQKTLRSAIRQRGEINGATPMGDLKPGHGAII
jgi:hypothetical protein